MLLKKRFVYVCKRRAESESRASDQGQSAKLLIHKNGSGAATRNSSETSIKHKMLRIEPRLAFINVILLANRVLIFRFQLLSVYVLLVHNCGECRIVGCLVTTPAISFLKLMMVISADRCIVYMRHENVNNSYFTFC
jgi:hypothetical protein